MNCEYVRIYKETAVIYMNVLFCYSAEVTEDTTRKLKQNRR
jgi:hypothetical protein